MNTKFLGTMSRLVRALTPFPLTTAGYIQYASQSVYANRSLGNPFRHVEIFLADTQKKMKKEIQIKEKDIIRFINRCLIEIVL